MMNLREINMTRVIRAIFLVMLIGGIIGSVYCAVKINERLDWAESTREPNISKEYHYQIVEDEVTSLGLYLAVSADIAVAGGLAGLALLFKRRFVWGRVRGLIFSLLGAFAILVLILVTRFQPFGYIEIVGMPFQLLFYFFLGVAFLFLCRRWMRNIVFILGGLLVMLGVFLVINAYISGIFESLQEFQIFIFVITMIGVGITILGMLFGLGAICWPRRKADELEDAARVSLPN